MSASRHRMTRRVFLSGIAGSAAAAILAACGGSSTATPAVATAAASTPATVAATNGTAAPVATTGSAATTAPVASAAASTTVVAGSAVAPSGPVAGTIVFGAAISLTGASANEGGLTRDGYNFWKKTVNDAGGIVVGSQRYLVDLKFYDDESSPDTSAKLTEKLITEDKVNLVLGPYGTGPTLSASAITEKYKMPMVEANGAADAIFNRGFKYVFCPITPAKYYLRGIIDACLDKDPTIKTVAILADNDTFSVEVADGTQSYAKEKNLNVIYYEKVPADTKDVSAQLTQIKPKNPDLFLSSGHYASAALVMKQSNELKFNPKAFGFSVGPALPQFTDSLKNVAEYVFGGTQWTPSLKFKDAQFGTAAEYATKFKAFAGYDPAYQNAESTCAGQCFQQAITKAGSLDSQKVRDALASLQFTSFYADVKFDSRGSNATKPMAAEQIQGGKKVTVWPKEAASGAIKYPTPPWDKR
ncbi:MAG: amino acid ABC transporter substrate-binding protein [Thermomicrobiales bacterium]